MRLFKTTAFRIALQFAAFFALLSIVTLLSVYYFTIYEVEAGVEKELLYELNEIKMHYEKTDADSLVKLINMRVEYGRHLQHYYTLISNDKQIIAGSDFLLSSQIMIDHEKQGVLFASISKFIAEYEHEVLVKYAQVNLSPDLKLLVGQAKNSLTEIREHVFKALLYAVMVTIILSLLVGVYMGRSVLDRINRIDSGMEGVIESDFTRLLAVPEKEDEFQALTLKLNKMLARIESLINGMRQVSDNIAHDLRSPLTRMRSRLEVTLLKNRDEAEYREVMQHVINDCDELLRTFNALLSITQAEFGVFRGSLEPVDLSVLVDELAEFYQVLVEEQGLTFKWHKPEKTIVHGSRHSLTQAVNNLLENAIKYTPEGGTIELAVCLNKHIPSIMVSDSGPGIPEKDRKRVLERFQRLDSARTKPGNGLGLSLVNAVVKLHHAELVLADNHPGLKVEIIFSGA